MLHTGASGGENVTVYMFGTLKGENGHRVSGFTRKMDQFLSFHECKGETSVHGVNNGEKMRHNI